MKWETGVLELVKAGGWLMLPILACSVLALAICIERLLALRTEVVAPAGLVAKVWSWLEQDQLGAERRRSLGGSSLGRILAGGLARAREGREAMKEAMVEAASGEVHQLERYLNSLGTVAAISPLLGLLGTVVGMIKVFTELTTQIGSAAGLSGGIAEALITTAAGLTVAIPALMMHRYFTRRVDTLVLRMEQEALRLVDALHSGRVVELKETA